MAGMIAGDEKAAGKVAAPPPKPHAYGVPQDIAEKAAADGTKHFSTDWRQDGAGEKAFLPFDNCSGM